MHKLHITRDLVLFIVGLLGIAYETVLGQAERPTLLIIFAAMVGLPVFLRLDDKTQAPKYEEKNDDSN